MSETQAEALNAEQKLLAVQLLVTAIFHPLDYVKVLIQLGYEPVPPRETTTLLGYPAMILPNVFQYIKFIKNSEGFFGCYRGLTPRMLGLFVTCQLTPKVIQACSTYLPDINCPPDIVTDDEPKINDYIKVTYSNIILSTTSTIISHPFCVVSVRMMASFVGKEEQYNSLFDSIISVYSDNGLLGFYSGIIPKLLGNVICVTFTGVLAYYVNKYLVKTKKFRTYTTPLLCFMPSSLAYPLVVVSTCMAVVGSSLQAGNPPTMSQYPSWYACLWDLYSNKQHDRGSSLFFRYVAPIAAKR